MRDRNAYFSVYAVVMLLAAGMSGCAHFARYPVNEPLKQAVSLEGSRKISEGTPGNSDRVLLILAFSGGGTRAAAFSYGVLEELRDREVTIEGKKRRVLDEVDLISAVSGGSFTAAYFGLFGNRIFQDFEERFLKKNIQGALTNRVLFNPINWLRLASPLFDRNDLAAEYYDKNIFDGKIFGDMLGGEGPAIYINATDMTSGARATFLPRSFNLICSDLAKFPVARACAASSAVPGVLTPITLKNYAGTCGFKLPEEVEKVLRERKGNRRQLMFADEIRTFMDSEKKPYIHLLDGGLSDNLGLRAAVDAFLFSGDIWTTLKLAKMEDIRKIAFILVNAEKAIDTKWDRYSFLPPFSAMVSSYSSIAIQRYNVETVALLQESFKGWTRDIQVNRCPPGQVSTEPGACGDIKFYLAEVKFADLENEEERNFFLSLPTSFRLKPEEVDKLREVARRLLAQSDEFQRLIRDLETEEGAPRR
jgi:NTE family protein